MKATRLVLMLLALGTLLALAACGDKVEYEETENAAPAGGHAAAEQAPAPAAQTAGNEWRVEVLETMNTGGYTYVKFIKDGAETWAAGPEMQGLAAGDEAVMGPGMKMVNFHASSLDRDFEEIWFVPTLEKAGASASAAAEDPHGGMGMTMQPAGGSNVVADASVAAVEKAAGGYTVAEIHDQAAALAGQTVKVRARVVKFTPNIMGTNWIHIQDGSGEGATADLTVTSSARVAVDDIVLIEGTLAKDKDFGAGYLYSVIVEGAEVTTE